MINRDRMDIAGILLLFYVNTIPHPREMAQLAAQVRAIPGDSENAQSPKFDTKNESESVSDQQEDEVQSCRMKKVNIMFRTDKEEQAMVSRLRPQANSISSSEA